MLPTCPLFILITVIDMNTINNSDFYYLSLSDKQLDFLSDTSGGINRMGCFLSLLRHTAIEQTDFTCRGITRTTHTGECNVSVSQLAKEWDCNRKTAIRLIRQLVLLGIVTTISDNLTTTVSMRRLAGWQNGQTVINNPLYLRYMPGTHAAQTVQAASHSCTDRTTCDGQQQGTAILPTDRTTDADYCGEDIGVETASLLASNFEVSIPQDDIPDDVRETMLAEMAERIQHEDGESGETDQPDSAGIGNGDEKVADIDADTASPEIFPDCTTQSE